jgi:NAD(P)H dehydrogenase (quinone)
MTSSTGATIPKIAVIFYSATGNVAALAEAIGDGARKEGAEVRVRPVRELAPPEAVASNPRWQAWVDANPYDQHATLDDLEWADGFALGSPTRFGGPAGQLKEFLDTTGGLWAKGKLVDKVATSFTSSSTKHGGLESTILDEQRALPLGRDRAAARLLRPAHQGIGQPLRRVVCVA